MVLGTSSSRYAAGAAFDAATGALQVGTTDGAVEMDCAEGVDTATLALSGVQQELLRRLHATGTPLVVVLINGARPLELPWLAKHIPAILEAWYPGQQGGRAIAEVLFGDYNPGGKLAITFPKSTLQLPLYYNALPKSRAAYCNMDCQPLYPFGYGLSYTTFAYSDYRLTPDCISAAETALVHVTITNTGTVAGDEVVQLYLRDDLATVCRPEQESKGFKRVHLAPGESTTVTFTVNAEHLQYLNHEYNWTVDPGTFTVMVGGNSLETYKMQLTIRE